MKRLTAVTATALLVMSMTAGIAGGTHGDGDGPRDFAVGAAKNTFAGTGGPNHLMVSAHGLEADLTGHVRAKGELPDEFKLEGEVTCLRVEGHRAAIKYRFKHAEGSADSLEGGGVQIFVEDNGKPRGGEAVDANTFDAPQPAYVFDTNASQCDDPTGRPYDPVDSGDYTVHGAD